MQVPSCLQHVGLRRLLTGMTAIQGSSRPTLAEVVNDLEAIHASLSVRDSAPSFITKFGNIKHRPTAMGDLAIVRGSAIVSPAGNRFSLKASRSSGLSIDVAKHSEAASATPLLQLTPDPTEGTGARMPVDIDIVPRTVSKFNVRRAIRKLMGLSKEPVMTSTKRELDPMHREEGLFVHRDPPPPSSTNPRPIPQVCPTVRNRPGGQEVRCCNCMKLRSRDRAQCEIEQDRCERAGTRERVLVFAIEYATEEAA